MITPITRSPEPLRIPTPLPSPTLKGNKGGRVSPLQLDDNKLPETTVSKDDN